MLILLRASFFIVLQIFYLLNKLIFDPTLAVKKIIRNLKIREVL